VVGLSCDYVEKAEKILTGEKEKTYFYVFLEKRKKVSL